MPLSFLEEVRALLTHSAEQNPYLHKLVTGEMKMADMGEAEAIQMLVRTDAVQTKLILKIAEEIDKLRAATNSG
jgi:hypothetical protein